MLTALCRLSNRQRQLWLQLRPASSATRLLKRTAASRQPRVRHHQCALVMHGEAVSVLLRLAHRRLHLRLCNMLQAQRGDAPDLIRASALHRCAFSA